MSALLMAFIVTAVVAAMIAALALAMWLWDEDRRLLGGVLGFLAFALPLAGLIAAIEAKEHSDGVHRWDGGSGPDTRCHYAVEDRLIPAGKALVPIEKLQTVCVDAEGAK